MSNIFRNLIFNILLVVFLSIPLVAQHTINTEVISIRDGLSSNFIRDIIQDQYGYLWVATLDGINIYDGYSIKVVKHDPEDSTSIPGNDIFRLFEDSEGTIWVSTTEGLAKYNREKNSYTTYRYSNSNQDGGNSVGAVFEDSRKNLWVSTSDGNRQFDRNTSEFKEFDVMEVDNSVKRYVNWGGVIVESNDGGLYNISQSFGLLKFDYDAELFVQVPLKDNFNERMGTNRYFTMVFDGKNNLWIAAVVGLFKIELDNNIGYDLTPFKKKSQISTFWDNAVSGLIIDKNENIWVGTGRNGLYLYNSKQNKFDKLIASSTIAYIGFFIDSSGLLWLGSTRGILKYDFDRKPFETYNITADVDENSSKAIFSFSNSKNLDNTVWLGSAQGVYLFNSIDNSISYASDKFRSLSQLNGVEVRSIFEQDKNNLWIGTANRGIFRYNLKNGSNHNYAHEFYNRKSIASDFIRSITSDKKGNVWVATNSGLNLFREKSNDFVLIPSFMNRRYEPELISKINELREQERAVSSIINVGDYVDLSKEFVLRKDSKVLIYALGEGLPQWNMADFGWLENNQGDTLWSAKEYSESFFASGGFKNRVKIGLLDLKSGRYKLRYKSDDSHSVESYNVIPPKDSTFWGTQIFSISDDEFVNLNDFLTKSESRIYLDNNNIKVVFVDSKNNIWAGTGNGLAKIDSNLIVKNYLNIVGNSNSLSNNSITDINEDLNGNVWVTTTGGLNKLDISNDSFTVLLEKDGLPSSILSSIEIDEDGDLWVSGLKGISKVELDEKSNVQIIVNYDVKDGLQGYEFLRNSSLRDKNGKIYFAGFDGFNAFYPGSSNRTPPYLSVQDIKISNKSIMDLEEFDSPNLIELSDLSLSHNQNDLSFEFASIHFSRPDKNRLSYKLDGVDEDWQVGDRRFASYTNLDPGDYVFLLKGSNGDGIWNEQTRKINISIAAPWYNNWTAYSLYAAIFLGLLFSVRKFETQRQQKNAQIKESQLQIEAAELKTKAVEAQAKTMELERRALQTEFEQKKKELDEARDLQLSMLPRELPQMPNLDIAVYMKTATEVGGDYYDFHIGMDGTLTVVLGDATGHGMKAGTMVTTTKSLFNVLAPNPNIVETFHEMTRCLKLMHLEKLSMCMTMIKIIGNKIQMSAAGMPPIFIYKRESQLMEEHLIKGMPLGTFNDFPYSVVESSINSGDTILLMSDGFPELMNSDKEMFGYKRTRNLFEELSSESPEDIITQLKDAGSEWVNDNDPDDDVTFVVLKVK